MENKMFEVRRAEEKDVPAIQKITKQAFLRYIELAKIGDIDALEETQEDVLHDIKTKLVYVAFIDDEVVGSVRIEVRDDKTAYLSRFAVGTAYQNAGIGKAMMNLVDIAMRHNGVRQLQLHTGAKITGLIRFYYGRGFYIDSTTKDKGYIRAFLCKDY